MYYTFVDVLEKHGPVPPFPASLQISTGNLSVTNLTGNAVVPNPSDTCMDVQDSTFTDNCGLMTRIYNEKFSCGPEVIFYKRKYIQGVGYFYHQYHGGNLQQGTEEYLISVHKANGASCGVVGTIPNGLTDVAGTAVSVSAFPNPCQEFVNLRLNTNEPFARYNAELKDIHGKQVKSTFSVDNQKETQVNVQDIEAGVYFIEIRKNGQLFATEKLLKN